MLEIFEEGESFSALGCTCACGCECICACGEILHATSYNTTHSKYGNEAMMDQFKDIAG